MTAECKQHGVSIPWSREEAEISESPYWNVRCIHFGNRFVLQINSVDTGFVAVDYVERIGDQVIIEAHSWVLPNLTEITDTWERLQQRIISGDPPNEEWST